MPPRLPGARQSGRHVQSPVLPRGASCRFLADQWPRAHKRHLPFEHVPNLGQLVEVGAPQEPPHPRDPRIVNYLEGGSVPFVQFSQFVLIGIGADHHRTKLVYHEPLAATAVTPLAVKDRAARGRLDRNGYQYKQRQQQDQPDKRAGHVHAALPGGCTPDEEYLHCADPFAGIGQSPPRARRGLLARPKIGWVAIYRTRRRRAVGRKAPANLLGHSPGSRPSGSRQHHADHFVFQPANLVGRAQTLLENCGQPIPGGGSGFPAAGGEGQQRKLLAGAIRPLPLALENRPQSLDRVRIARRRPPAMACVSSNIGRPI